MWPFRKQKSIEVPFNELVSEFTQENNQSEVVETIEALQIPRNRLIVVGSGVLALLGLPRRAEDLDIVLNPENLEELQESGKLPSGQPVTQATFSRPNRLHFTADTHPLPVELFSHNEPVFYESFESVVARDTVLLGDIEDISISSDVPSDLRVVSPAIFEAKVANHLKLGVYIGTPSVRRREYMQDIYDHELIKTFRARKP